MIYVISVSNYDLIRFEGDMNRMTDALEIFKIVMNEESLNDTPFIIMWTKNDVLKKNIEQEDKLKDLFSDYTGGKNYDKALEFIQSKFRAEIPEKKKENIVKEIVGVPYKREIIKELVDSVSDYLFFKLNYKRNNSI